MKINECVLINFHFFALVFVTALPAANWLLENHVAPAAVRCPDGSRAPSSNRPGQSDVEIQNLSYQKVSNFWFLIGIGHEKRPNKLRIKRKGHKNPANLNPVDIFEQPLIVGRVKWSLGGWEILGSLQIHVSSVQNPWNPDWFRAILILACLFIHI